jgi:hypothetical protein
VATEIREVAVSLRPADEGPALFLAHWEALFRNGSPEPEPIDYEGRRYVFAHTLGSREQTAAQQPPVYVFVES